jgi:uncharacterized protein
MKNSILTIVMTACVLLYLPAWGVAKVRTLTWQDLVPAYTEEENPLVNLTREQQELAYYVVAMLDMLPERGPGTEEFYREIDEAMPSLKRAGINIEEVRIKLKALQSAIVEELDGQSVRIPGYLLPLEMSGTKITEFLLVPYVGACIHVPPPPPNQIVYVKVARSGGYKSDKLFDPVWVTGKITAKPLVKDLFLTDGSAGIDIGYTMQASRVEPYKE